MEEAFLDPDLAKLGDVLVNFIYSLGRSIARGQPDGDKIPNSVLAAALVDADLRDLAPSRVDRHQIGDVVEAILAYAWLQEDIEISRAAEVLASSLEGVDFQDRDEVLNGAEEGFKNLLLKIADRESLERG
ncbi:hypothetical protein AKJ47_02355 [candidate division MSBL1 archaeon SCGC-AAA261G05]|uniref:Uncharacterized protein n=1 Tax=candidate division MSBL1 archaeon SCGC-AAA261G05 TaxID=1698276 RepID=A0A133VAB8_9EURY|nr:hypothetical protein AKJ47_02355 [candidate division MSBL1 archaeon SCGC-AAA261G05]